MRPYPWVIAGIAAALCSALIVSGQQRKLLAFFEPTVEVTTGDRARLERGEVIARALPSDDGQIALFAVSRLNAPPEALLAWTRDIEALKRSPLVLGVGRFSNPAVESDVDGVALENGELDALRRCRVGNCDLKLGAAEIAEVQQALRRAGPDWREEAQRVFRHILIARVRLHRDRGLLALPTYVDGGRRVSVGEAFSAITARSPYLTRALPDLVNSLIVPERDVVAEPESIYYWSRERYGAGRTVVTVTYVRLLRNIDPTVPQALTLSTQLYASHYIEGSLGLSAVTCDESRTTCYLAYLNRSQVDLLGGFFGAFKRAAIERRIETDGPKLLRGVRLRLESGAPGAEGGESMSSDGTRRSRTAREAMLHPSRHRAGSRWTRS